DPPFGMLAIERLARLNRLDRLLMDARRQRIIPKLLELVGKAHGKGFRLAVLRQRKQCRLLVMKTESSKDSADRPVADFRRWLFMAEAIEPHYRVLFGARDKDTPRPNLIGWANRGRQC